MENLERAEVIRGPQAATFGRGTFAGAVNFITRRPGDEMTGRVKLDFSDHSMTDIRAFISGPLIAGVLAGEINVQSYERGEDPGYTNLAQNGSKIGEEQTTAVGFKLLWSPSDTSEIYLNVNYSEVADGTFAYGNWNGGDNADEAAVNANSPDSINCFAPLPPVAFRFGFIPINPTRTRGYYCGEIESNIAWWDDIGTEHGVERDTLTVGLNMDFDIGSVTLSSITGYTDYDYQNAFPAIYSGTTATMTRGNGFETFSQELRLTSNNDGALNWTAGVYMYDQTDGDIWEQPGGYDPASYDPAFPGLTPTFSDSKLENRAVFAGIDYDVSDTLNMFAEVRYQKEESTLAGTDAAGAERFDGSPKIEFSATLPRVGFSWAASEQFNIYGTIAEGNSPGDFNSAYYSTRYDAANRAQFVDARGSYEESDVRTYELGLKGTFLDGRMSMNIAAFLSDWEKQALTQTDALTNAGATSQATIPYIVNAGESEVQGIEIEILARPSDNWDLGFSYSLADSQFKDYLDENWADLQDTNGLYNGNDYNGNIIVDTVDDDGQVAGNELPQTPRHMASLNSTFHWPFVAGNGEAYVRFDYTYEAKRYVQATNLAWIGASSRLNMRAGIAKDNWEFAVWAKNLTDDDTPEGVTRLLDFRSFFYIPSQDRPPPGGFVPPAGFPDAGLRFNFPRDFTVTGPRTREIGATFTYNF
jgi:outer membrane receptor protein involved in Fe transport